MSISDSSYIEWCQIEQYPGVEKTEVYGSHIHVYFDRNARLSEIVEACNLIHGHGLQRHQVRIEDDGYVVYSLKNTLRK